MRQMLDAVESRIKNAGDRVSQAVQATVYEYGNVSATEAAEIIGCDRRQLYRLAKRGGVIFTKGRRPVLKKELAA